MKEACDLRIARQFLSLRREDESTEALCALAGVDPSMLNSLGDLTLPEMEMVASRLNVSPAWLAFDNA